jgi:cytochrome c-type biogenesis protein
MLNTLPNKLNQLPSRRNLIVAGVALIVLFLIFGPLGQTAVPADSLTGFGGQSLAVLALMAFVGGVVSFASPCTLPILPAYFAFATQSGRSRIALNTVAFMLGVATMFSLLGASASAVGRLFIQNQELLLIFGGAIVMVFGIMSLLGKGFTGMSNNDGGSTAGTGAKGSYAFGLTFSLGWSSCVGPILGIVLTLAASTGSVSRGMFLLFVYAIGLGLPLIIVSTFFGRASRKSLFWRVLRGKGWFVNTHVLIVAVVWALAFWRILVAFTGYGFDNLSVFAAQELTAGHQIGLLLIAIAGTVLWVYSQRARRITTLQLHTTQLFSGVLFIFMAVLMLSGALADFNALIPADLAIWFSGLEDQLLSIFNQ